jgi:branched-chain amino acid aminotransferase
VAQEGFQQNLWLLGPDHVITEVGTMNLFVFRTTPNGMKQLFTPSLDDGTILPGVTRQSILELTRSWGEFEVIEGRMTMGELIKGLSEGRILEVFGSGTAAVISPVKKIRFHGVDYDIPLDPENPTSQAGPLARRLWDAITKIQYGETPHEWSVEI